MKLCFNLLKEKCTYATFQLIKLRPISRII